MYDNGGNVKPSGRLVRRGRIFSQRWEITHVLPWSTALQSSFSSTVTRETDGCEMRRRISGHHRVVSPFDLFVENLRWLIAVLFSRDALMTSLDTSLRYIIYFSLGTPRRSETLKRECHNNKRLIFLSLVDTKVRPGASHHLSTR